MKKIPCFLILFSFFSCRYFNVDPVNGITFKNLSHKPAVDDIAGSWELDKISYNVLKDENFENRKVQLEFENNGTFTAINFSDFQDIWSNKIVHKILNTKGKWEVVTDFKDERWVLQMSFFQGDLENVIMATTYNLYIKNDKLIFWTFIGDPDSGNRLLFTKTETE